MIRYQCDECGSTLKIKDKLAGTPGKCPKCKKKFTVPQPDGAEPADKKKSKKKKKSGPVAEVSEEDAIFGAGFFDQKDERSPRPTYTVPTDDDDDDDSDEDLPGDRIVAAAPKLPTSKENAANMAGNLLGKTGKKNAKEEQPSDDKQKNDYSAVIYLFTHRLIPAVVGLVVLTYVFYNFLGGMMSDPRLIPNLASVKGTVSVDGKPVFAELTFDPLLLPHEQKSKENATKGANSKAWSSRTDGSYTAMYSGDIEGAILGKHTVKIHVSGGGMNIIEMREIVIREGPNTHNFNLKAPPTP